jgi:hypothetical protein
MWNVALKCCVLLGMIMKLKVPKYLEAFRQRKNLTDWVIKKTACSSYRAE